MLKIVKSTLSVHSTDAIQTAAVTIISYKPLSDLNFAIIGTVTIMYGSYMPSPSLHGVYKPLATYKKIIINSYSKQPRGDDCMITILLSLHDKSQCRSPWLSNNPPPSRIMPCCIFYSHSYQTDAIYAWYITLIVCR